MSDIDDKVAAAWRSTSREEPPAAIDTALRAAARRAVHAGPARTRRMQSWPLAAAAVVAVLAIGILQLTPPEEVTPGIVADSTMRQAPASKLEAAAPAMPAATTSEPAPPPAAVATPTPAPTDKSRRAGYSATMGELASASRQVAQVPPASPGSSLDRLKEKPDAVAETDAVKKNLGARADVDQPMESKLAAARDARESAAAPAPRAQPFPATGAGTALAGSDAGRGQGGSMSAAPASPPASPAAVAANEPAKPQVTAANAMRTEESQAQGRAPAPEAMAKIASAPQGVKDAAIKPPDEWIKLIRRLKSEGRNDEAARELAAFRTAYKERADSLLPPDLRAARP